MNKIATEKWTSKNLGSLVELIMGQSPISETYNQERIGLPFFQGKTDFGYKEPVMRFWCSHPLKVAPKYSILFSVRAPVGDVNLVAYDCCIGRGLAAIVATNIDRDFLFQKLQYLKPKFQTLSQGSTFEAINTSQLKEFVIDVPSIFEQKKIAAILTSVDTVIEKTKAQIEKLQLLKKGMMQELLFKGIGHNEFKDSPLGKIPKKWDITTYRKILQKIDSGWSPTCIDTPPNIGEWGILKVSAVTRGRFLEDESKSLPNNLEPRDSIRVKRGDILLTRANGVAELVGKCVKVIEEPKRKLMMSDKILRLAPEKNIYPDFLLHLFNSSITRNQIEQSWSGSSGQKNISQESIKAFILPLPPLQEQKIIGESLSSVEKVIDQKMQYLENVKNIKKGLMQDLLTGKVRVTID